MNKIARTLRLPLAACILFMSCGRPPTVSFAPTPAADVSVLSRTFLQAIADGDWAAAIQFCDANMTRALPPEKLRGVWTSLALQFGAFRGFGTTRTERSSPYDSVYAVCEFEGAKLDARVVFDKEKRVTGLWFAPHQNTDYEPPPYVSASSFRDQEASIGSGASPLPATLSVPERLGPLPAIVLVHGSGPNDRDETVGACKPFRDLAEGLASQGIVVLRYEKRTRAFPQEIAALQQTLTVNEEVIDDVLAAVAVLRNNPIVDPGRVFVLGHSLGGTLVPRVGAADSHIAGFVIMAGATRPLEDLVLTQSRYLAELDGLISAAEQQDLEALKQQVQAIKDPRLSVETAPGGVLGASAAYWLDLRDYRPGDAAAKLNCPLLVLQGGRDYQVTVQDFDGWRHALDGRADVTFRIFPELNHLFIAGEGRSTPAEYDIAGHIDQEVLDLVANWIHDH